MKNLDQRLYRPEVERVFQQQNQEICIRLDRFFAFFMVIQWLAAALLGSFYSSKTWLGEYSDPLGNFFVGLLFGGFFAIPTLFFTWKHPGEKATRVLVAFSQMAFSVLFIYLSGGRTETHFHIFVSLAALAFYKDISLLIIATAVMVVHHLVGGAFLPMAVYGVAAPQAWRWAEHLGWILIEDTILILGILKLRQELRQMALSKVLMIEAREEALRLSSQKSNFLSSMSHEIRTPLNSIVGFSDLLKDTELADEQVEYVRTIHRCSESLLHLISDILDISKIENGLMQVDRHCFDMRELHEDIHKVFAEKCRSKNLKFKIDIEDGIAALVNGDSFRLRQILLNLVGNAVKFTEHGEVVVQVKKDPKGGIYHWKVKDTGRGVSSENIDKLFNSFFQEDPSVSRKFGGSGLGLMITKNLVELMGGSIQVESLQGKGSTFSFSLPIEES